jgi:peptidyl-prolyl cis-trans isomerase A (cyclophilin A)
MRKLLFSLLGCSLALMAPAVYAAPSVVELQTNLGTIAIQLDYVHAPITANNFVKYATSGFYRNVFFHRLVKGFVLQGGGYSITDGKLKAATFAPIVNEANNGLSNLTRTVAMARTSDPNSATSQFFINLKDNTFLNYSASSPGYAVFGSVTAATMPVVRAIENLAGNYNELPFIRDAATSAAGLVTIDAVYTSAALNTTQSITRISLIGTGKVTSTPAGINCGSGGAVCSMTQTKGSAMSLAAAPAAGYYFAGWRGDCKGFIRPLKLDTAHGNHNCTAVFKPQGAAIQ